VRIEASTDPSVLEWPPAIFGEPKAISRIGGATHERPERRDP
jgi:hypothetical protein